MKNTVTTQNVEFDALDKLVKQRDRLYATAVVDDDYPEVRYDYENALWDFIQAMEHNARFTSGNRYGLRLA